MSAAMSCDVAREELSARFDGEGSDTIVDATGVNEHVATCERCQTFAATARRVRQEVRLEPVGETPDVAGRVLARLAASPATEAAARDDHVEPVEPSAPVVIRPTAEPTRTTRRGRTRRWLPAAACFVVGLLVGGLVVSGGTPAPQPAQAATLPERLLQAQQRVQALTASVTVTEHGWQAAVPQRSFTGALAYRAPEALDLRLDDRTAYPAGPWAPNDLRLVADGARFWSSGLRPCPTSTPACPTGTAIGAVDRRAPFSTASPVPLDLVVPVQSFARARDVELLGTREVDDLAAATGATGTTGDRRATGVATTAAQIGPLLEAFRLTGNLRAVFPTDRVELWLDDELLTPVLLRVRASDDLSRRTWQANHGYTEQPGDVVLEVAFALAPDTPPPADAFPPAPEGVVPTDAGFGDQPLDAATGIAPAHLPAGFGPYRSGLLGADTPQPVAVRSYADGRAWVVVASTTTWNGTRLFGDLGDAVRVEALDNGTAYSDAAASTIAIHADGIDVTVTGTVAPDELRRIATSLPVRGLPVPASWSEGGTVSLEQAAGTDPDLLVARDLPGFDTPAVRLDGSSVTSAYLGAGSRAFVLRQGPADHLAPPLDQDVAAVRVRGEHEGRYSATRGELEWLDGGRAYSLRSTTLSLGELLAVAKRLGPP